MYVDTSVPIGSIGHVRRRASHDSAQPSRLVVSEPHNRHRPPNRCSWTTAVGWAANCRCQIRSLACIVPILLLMSDDRLAKGHDWLEKLQEPRRGSRMHYHAEGAVEWNAPRAGPPSSSNTDWFGRHTTSERQVRLAGRCPAFPLISQVCIGCLTGSW